MSGIQEFHLYYHKLQCFLQLMVVERNHDWKEGKILLEMSFGVRIQYIHVFFSQNKQTLKTRNLWSGYVNFTELQAPQMYPSYNIRNHKYTST